MKKVIENIPLELADANVQKSVRVIYPKELPIAISDTLRCDFRSLKWNGYILIITVLLLMLTGCTCMQVNHTQPINLPTARPIAVFPFNNMTETPQADERAASITTALLRAKGAPVVIEYPVTPAKMALIPGVTPPVPRATLLGWARYRSVEYAITGSVSEWRYKVGLDGEPVVGVTLKLINVYTGETIWSAVGSKSGGSRTALSTVAQQLINTMLSSILLTRG